MRKVLSALRMALACVLFVALLSGCPTPKFKLFLENTGATNTITGLYLVEQGSKDPAWWGPNLLNVDPDTAYIIPIPPGTGMWIDHEFTAGPTYDWMVEFSFAVGDLQLPVDGPVSESNGQLVLEPGMNTKASVKEISAIVALEPGVGGGTPSYAMGYNWGSPQKDE
jgi:hypothetical protein